MRFLVRALLLLLLLATTALAGRDYDHYLLGNPTDVAPATTAGTVLMGGGTDVDAAFAWMIGKAGGGDFVVIRTEGTDAYNPYINSLGTVDSVATLIIKTRRGASDPFVVSTIRNAEAVFIAGGDQAEYLRLWKGTPLADALQGMIDKPAPIGGTSAGLAVLGDCIFSARNGTVYSDEALADPYNRYLTLTGKFVDLPILSKVITDSHFDASDRMGRLLTFVGRLIQDGRATEAFGIGVDEATAVLVEPDGSATLAGGAFAYFLRGPGRPQVCAPGIPLTYLDVPVYRIGSGGSFDLPRWQGNGGLSYSLSAQRGRLTSSQPGGEIY